MAAQVPAHAWVTTDTGLLKAVNLAKRTATNFYDGAQPSKEEAIKYMTSPTKHSLLTISQNGKVKKFENGKFTLLHESNLENPMFLDSLSSIKLESSVEGDKADTITDSVVHCYKSGEVFVNENQIYKATFKDENKIGVGLECGACLSHNKLVIGGNDFLPECVDLETGKQAWKAKNVSHNWLDLYQPIWQKSLVKAADTSFYTVNAYGYLRKYDTRCGKKPTHQTSVKELGAVPDIDEIFTCVDQIGDSHELTVGGNRGSTLLLDSRHFPSTKDVQILKPVQGRNNKSVIHKFKASDGGVRSICSFDGHGETPELIATCGGDRKLRIYEKNGGKMSHLVYLKSQLTQILMVPGCDFVNDQKRIADEKDAEIAEKAAADSDNEIEEEDDATIAKRRKEDDLWEQLMTATTS